MHENRPYANYPDTLAFMVTPEMDVFSNVEEPMEWWRLGNLDRDGLDSIMDAFELVFLDG